MKESLSLMGWRKLNFSYPPFFYQKIFSISLPTTNRSSSFRLFAIRCNHTGIFSHLSSIVHTGIEIAGNPARFAGSVYISDRYIFTGLSTFSQIFRATSGVVGLRIKSYFWKILSKSWIIFCFTLRALR